jgi:hypothetical protein
MGKYVLDQNFKKRYPGIRLRDGRSGVVWGLSIRGGEDRIEEDVLYFNEILDPFREGSQLDESLRFRSVRFPSDTYQFSRFRNVPEGGLTRIARDLGVPYVELVEIWRKEESLDLMRLFESVNFAGGRISGTGRLTFEGA